jgi:hypothetical protein
MSTHPPGRPRSLTLDKQQELLAHVAHGSTVEESAETIGVSLRTVQREAQENESFNRDLHRALDSAPTDPYQLMLRAARTHWRAAAWLLERSDPDRFGKRSPNSCRPEQMMELASSLIEAALAFVPSEQRELLDRRLQTVADETLEALLPHQRVGALAAYRPTPLPDEDRDCRSTKEKLEVAAAREEVLSPKMHFATKPAATEVGAEVTAPAALVSDEVLSPEMHEATEPCATVASAASGSPQRMRAVDRKALHVIERNEARRVRRKAARAKRKARKAA